MALENISTIKEYHHGNGNLQGGGIQKIPRSGPVSFFPVSPFFLFPPVVVVFESIAIS